MAKTPSAKKAPERITTDDYLGGCTRAALEETKDRVTFVFLIRFKTR